MGKSATISALKSLLLKDVSYLCRRVDRRWAEPTVHMFRELKQINLPAVFFGGTLRSLLLSRFLHQQMGRPRDIDIVVSGTNIDNLRDTFHQFITRETRFGGLQLARQNWQFDLWPLQKTWAFAQDPHNEHDFEALPFTTFFNLEAIAVDVWPKRGYSRKIYSGDDQFFNGILSRVLEINREENPFPALCVIRALVFVSSTGFSIGPRLSRYLVKYGLQLSDEEILAVQIKHYGQKRCDVEALRKSVSYIASELSHGYKNAIRLPFRQRELWPEIEKAKTNFNLHVITSSIEKERTVRQPIRRSVGQNENLLFV